MDRGFGHETPAPHTQREHQDSARYLVLIESGGTPIACLFLANREQVAEFDAGSEEVISMARGLQSSGNASGAEWDAALGGHSPAERAAASVYLLDT